jgi:hypothetical protein
LDTDLTSRSHDEEKIGKITHELHMELRLAHSPYFQSSMAVRTHEDVSGTYGLMEELLVMVERKDHSDLHGLDEMYDLETFDYTHGLYLGDHDPFLLGSPLTAQVITIDGRVEHIPCGTAIREVCAPTYCGNGYIEVMHTSVWDCRVIPSKRLLDKDLEHIIEFRLSRGEKLIDEIHRATYSSKIDLRMGYHKQGCGGAPPPPLEPVPESRSQGEHLGSALPSALPERSPSGAFLGSALPHQKLRSLVFEGASRERSA